MKILAIGDFHGKFPAKLKKKILKEDFDLIVSPGDFPDTDKIRKIIFRHWTDKEWWEVIGLNKAKKLEKESFKSGLEMIRELNSLGKKSYIVWGNSDFYKNIATSEPKSIIPGNYDKKIKKMNNIILIDKKKRKINNFEIIGHGGYVDVTEFIKTPIDKDKKKQKKRLRRYKKDENKLKKLFWKKKPKKDFIFLIHYTPYRIFDKVKTKKSPMYGKHVGWWSYNKIIKKYKPVLVICGHMHENQGKKKSGKTWIVNPGAARDGKAALIELDEKKLKVKSIKFLR